MNKQKKSMKVSVDSFKKVKKIDKSLTRLMENNKRLKLLKSEVKEV